VRTLTTETENEFIGLDAATRRNLELTETIRGQESPTLFSLLDTAAPPWVRACCATGCTMRGATRRWARAP
jgi:DNA mismatch repair ATPase MutS